MKGSPVQVRASALKRMGHADIQTTMRYLHYAPREGDAALVAEAFEVEGPGDAAKKKTRPTRDRVV